MNMAEYLGLRIEKKEGTDDTCVVTISKESPISILANYKGVAIENVILHILLNAQKHVQDQFMNDVTYC